MSNYKSPLLTRKEASRYLNISTSSLDRLADSNEFPKRKMGKIVRYLRADLDEYINRCYGAGFNTSFVE
jgi:excisionase family DNA binding protein